MKAYIIFDKKSGKITSTGACQDICFGYGLTENQAIIEGQANDVTQKVIDGKIVDKTPEEIEAEKPKPVEIPETERPMVVTKGQLESILKRIAALEMKT